MKQETYRMFWDRGWVVVPGVFTAEEIEPIKTLAMSVATSQSSGSTGDAAEMDLDEKGEFVPRKVMSPFVKSPDFRRFVLSEKFRTVIAEFVGKPVQLVSDQIFLKPPRHGSAKPYHQDNAYFRCSPSDEVITAWIALDDVDESNGCLRYIDGSHRLPILEHHEMEGQKYNLQPSSADIDLSRESLAPVLQGGVVFHHSHTLHTSHANTSDRWRRAYATHWVTADVTSEIDTLDRGYFRAYKELYDEVLAVA